MTAAVKEGDELTLTIPVEISMQGLPDGGNAFAFRYGGVVLAAELGSGEGEMETAGVQVTVPSGAPQETAVKVNDLFGLFEEPTKFFTREGENFVMKSEPPLAFVPFYSCYQKRYALYVRVKE